MSEPVVSSLPSGIVTLLLTDIVGSTAMWESHQTAMAEALARHDELIEQTVASHSGTLLKSRGEGDSTFSVFTRASDAATAALEIQRLLATETWPGGLRFQLRMALNTGETVERDGDYYGTVVNRTARLRAIAGPNQIFLSQSTAEVVAELLDDATLTELGPQALAGLSRPERVFQLHVGTTGEVEPTVSSGGMPSTLRAMAQDSFVGRHDELTSLQAMWERSAYGSRGIAFLAGEPGIGKTRLSAELASHVHKGGGLVLFGRCDQDLGAAYQPFVEALDSYASTRPATLLRAEVGTDARYLARLVPTIADLVASEHHVDDDNAEADRFRLFEATSRMLEQIGSRHPVLVILDDLHWATKPTLLMLRHLARSLHDARVMLLGTYRDTDVDTAHPLSDLLADLRRESGVERIPLSGITPEDVGTFLARSAGKEMDDRELNLARTVHSGTNGNPFFMREVLRHLVNTGAIHRRDGEWVTDTSAVAAAGLPESVREVIGHRLSALSPEANRALMVASVIGSNFSIGLLEQIPEAADDPDRLLDALDEAVRARVLVEGTLGYSFAHALIRQTLNDGISATRRARLHLRIAQTMEQAKDRTYYLDALALHYAEAGSLGDPIKAAEYALAAGRAALSSLAYEGATGVLERGLNALKEVPGQGVLNAELLLALAEARQGAGDDLGSRESALEAATVAREIGSGTLLARAAHSLTYEIALGIRNDELTSICLDALAQLDSAQNPTLHARLLASIGRVQAFVSRDRVATDTYLSRALEVAKKIPPRDRAEVLMICFPGLIGFAPPSELLEMAEEMVEIARELDERRLLAEALMPSFQAKLGVGDVDGFNADLDEFIELAAQIRWPFLLAVSELGLGLRATIEGRFDETERRGAAMLAHSPGDPRLTSFNYALLLVLRWDQGRLEGMRGFLEIVHAHRPDITAVGGYLARLLAYEGDTVAADAQIAKMMADDFAIVPHDAVRLTGMSILSEGVLMRGDVERIKTMIKALSPNSGEIVYMGRVVVIGAADRYLAQLHAALGEWDEAERLFEAALELEGRLRSAQFIARTHTSYSRMLLARGGTGDRERAAEMLESALGTAQELTMLGLIEEIRQLQKSWE